MIYICVTYLLVDVGVEVISFFFVTIGSRMRIIYLFITPISTCHCLRAREKNQITVFICGIHILLFFFCNGADSVECRQQGQRCRGADRGRLILNKKHSLAQK